MYMRFGHQCCFFKLKGGGARLKVGCAIVPPFGENSGEVVDLNFVGKVLTWPVGMHSIGDL